VRQTLYAINRALEIIAGAQRQPHIVCGKGKNAMKFISLFAGIGGFDLGLERAGMQCVGQVEIDSYCQSILSKHWPDVKRMGDIRDVTAESFESVELICGGFPCQPFSVAGQRKGKSDNRFLWPEMCRVIQAYRPAWVLGENVAGIIDMALDDVLSELESYGYSVQCFVIPACAVDAAHRRDRVWIIAHSTGIGWDCRENTSEGCLARTVPTDSIESGCGWTSEIRRVPGISWLQAASEFCGVDDGISKKLDNARLKACGNSVHPGIVEEIGKAIRRAHIVCAECAPENTSEARLTAYNKAMVGSTRKF
jgi:DNA (cytosine-5)-methyltransferase 1